MMTPFSMWARVGVKGRVALVLQNTRKNARKTHPDHLLQGCCRSAPFEGREGCLNTQLQSGPM